MLNSLDNLVLQLTDKENVALYGAGTIGKRLGRYLLKKGIQIFCFLVTDKSGSEEEILDLPVYSLRELDEGIIACSDLNIVIAVSPGNARIMSEIKNNCFNREFAAVFCITKEICNQLAGMEAKKYIPLKECYIEIKQKNRDFPILYENESHLPMFRVMGGLGAEQIKKIEHFGEKSEYEKLFGKLRIFFGAEYESDTLGKRNITVYVVSSHRDKMEIKDVNLQYEIPIQAGAADTDIRKGFLTDDIGDNISEKNRDYCECTALYWIWKNKKSKNGYVGLEHYRRRLVLSKKNLDFLSQQYDIDVILGLPQFYVDTVYSFFTNIITDYDWQLMKHAAIETDPECSLLFEQYEQSHFYFSCNLCIFKWEWFEKYCSFAFSIAEKIEQHFKKRHIYRNDRYMGYIFENLLSIFMMRHKKEMSVFCTEVGWIDSI